MASHPSGNPPAKKRPRLGNESNESSNLSVESSSSPSWNLKAAIAAQTASETQPTLDTTGNPMFNHCITPTEFSMLYSPPVRDLDWRNGDRKHLNTYPRRQSALGQRYGTVALPGQECAPCKRGLGSFEPCVVFHAETSTKELARGACMNCYFRYRAADCSFRGPRASNGVIYEKNPDPFLEAVNEGSAPSSTSIRPKQRGPMYSAKWYKPPLDDRSLAKDINGMIAVREDLREIRDRVAYDIKKLSKFAGDGRSEEETLEDNEPNPFYNSDSEYGGDDTGSVHARSENDGSEVDSVGSLDVGSVDLNSDDVDSVDVDE